MKVATIVRIYCSCRASVRLGEMMYFAVLCSVRAVVPLSCLLYLSDFRLLVMRYRVMACAFDFFYVVREV